MQAANVSPVFLGGFKYIGRMYAAAVNYGLAGMPFQGGSYIGNNIVRRGNKNHLGESGHLLGRMAGHAVLNFSSQPLCRSNAPATHGNNLITLPP
jgi:hypothetical protein